MITKQMKILDKIMTYYDCRSVICDLLVDDKIDVKTAEMILKALREKVGDELSKEFDES